MSYSIENWPAIAGVRSTLNASNRRAVVSSMEAAQAASIPKETLSLDLAGYATEGDGGFGQWKRVSAQPTHTARFRSLDRILPDGTISEANGGWWEYVPILGKRIDVRALGGKGDGATSDTAAFAAALSYVKASRTTTVYSDALTMMDIFVPAGRWIVDTAETLLGSNYTTKTQGFTLRGEGLGRTQIIFTAASGVMLYNQAFLVSVIEDITFVGTSRLQTFYRSDMTVNNQQGWVFNRCSWIGTWAKGTHLTGTNNNSEHTFNDCRGGGEMGCFLYAPSTGGSDQFLNYRFNNCYFWFTAAPAGTAGAFTGGITGGTLTVTAQASGTLAVGQTIAVPGSTASHFSDRLTGVEDKVVITALGTGSGGTGTYTVNTTATIAPGTSLVNLTDDMNCLVDMAKGGHIHFEGGDMSGWNSGTYFKLRGTSHAYGVCYFSTNNVRYELKTPRVHMMYSEWSQGAISFIGNDLSSSTSEYVNADGTYPIAFWFNFSNVPGPMISFERCDLIGRVVISHAANDFETKKVMKFAGCRFGQLADPFDAFTFLASTNDIGHPYVELVDCYGNPARVALAGAWAANTAYTVGTKRYSNGARSIYICTTAGTSGAAASAFTGSISGTTLTVSAVGSGTLSVGQTLGSTYGASITADTTNTSTTVTVSAVGSGQLIVGQVIAGAGIPTDATITAFGTFNGTSGTITISAAATATASGVTLAAYGQTVLTDTVITALGTGSGGTGTYTVSRSQTVLSQSLTGVGGPQSASTSIPDGTAVWSWFSNNGRDYFNDGGPLMSTAITVYRPNMKRRIAFFGGSPGTNSAGSLGKVEVVLPPNAIVIGAGIKSPNNAGGGTSSGNPADYRMEMDDGTLLVKGRAAIANQGFAFDSGTLFLPVRANKQKRRVRIVAGGYGGSTTDTNNGVAAWVEYMA